LISVKLQKLKPYKLSPIFASTPRSFKYSLSEAFTVKYGLKRISLQGFVPYSKSSVKKNPGSPHCFVASKSLVYSSNVTLLLRRAAELLDLALQGVLINQSPVFAFIISSSSTLNKPIAAL